MGPQDRLNMNVLSGELRDALVSLGYAGVVMWVTPPAIVIELEKGDTGMMLTLTVTDPSGEE